jgi:hypothetical protein
MDQQPPEQPRLRGRRTRAGIAMAAAALATVVVGGATADAAVPRIQAIDWPDGLAGLGGSSNQSSETVDASVVLQGEIDAMLAAGVPADHPKVQRLQADLDALGQGASAPAAGEPGLDLSGTLGAPHNGARSVARDADTDTVWDRGPVMCEPIPALLDVEEINGARCLAVPQPDGSHRYVALGPDSTVRMVHFRIDGTVVREPDAQIGRVGSTLSDVDPAVE